VPYRWLRLAVSVNYNMIELPKPVKDMLLAV
jgi:hypothetical protein